ncbi:MAG TPA: dihydrofolate reductase family protein [Solirubrobacteraceae bacterium]|nr:dihydrofolate reductase family protein [Solirubrobacteraceae bacterium]
MSAPVLRPQGDRGDALTVDEYVARLGLWERAGARGRIVAGMIGSADGRATVEGRAGGLSDPVDRALLRAMRAPVDAMLVGAGTLVAEGYANLLDARHREQRAAHGMPEAPVMATISRGLSPALAEVPLFSERGQRIVVFTESEHDLPGHGADVALERFAPGDLTVAGCVERLSARGARTILSEGGPTLLHELARAGLLGELVLTIAAMLVSGDGRSVVHGPVFDPPLALSLQDVARAGDYLFLRYTPRP